MSKTMSAVTLISIQIMLVILLGVCREAHGDSRSAYDRFERAKQAQEYVRRVEDHQSCLDGAGMTLNMNFDHSGWRQHADVAIRTANFLSQIIALDGDLGRFDDDVFYALVLNNVHDRGLIYGSAIALQRGTVPGKMLFSPYAYHKDFSVQAFDLSDKYDYTQSTTEWYHAVHLSDLSNVDILHEKVTFNESMGASGMTHIQQPVASYDDGRWSKPYYDCGGGNTWMISYSSPIVKLDGSSVVFKGVATIDIDLTNIDINQCDADDDAHEALDDFRGTHMCQPSTTCVPLKEGFKTEAYQCECNKGYYFPTARGGPRAFMGGDIVAFFESFYDHSGNIGDYVANQFQCQPCMSGCDMCADGMSCIYPQKTWNVAPQARQTMFGLIMGLTISFAFTYLS